MTMRRVAAVVLVLAAACGASKGAERTIDVGGEKVAVAPLTDAAAGLCQARRQAATDAVAARASFYDRAHEPLHTVARALEPIDRAQAAAVLEAKEKVEADLAAPPSDAALAADLGRLADAYRAGLGRLAISVPPCDK